MENKNIYILEASAYHWAKDEHISLLEQKQWIGYGDIGKDKLEKKMKQIAKLWQEVYIDNRDDTQVIIHDDYLAKHLLQEFINNVVADLFADMLLQPKGRGHINSEEIKDIINQLKM